MEVLDFRPLDAQGRQLIKEYLGKSGYLGSDFSYFAYLIWFDSVEYAEGDGALFLRAFFDGKLGYWRPLLKDGMTVVRAVEQLPPLSVLFNCTDTVVSEMEKYYDAAYDRDYSEYIYLTDDFISLIGKRYNAKRNHIHKFNATYNWEMRPYEECDRAEVLRFEERWLSRHVFGDESERKSALREREIMFAAVDASLEGKTVCDLLRVDGKLAGFSVGERLSDECAVIIYEKADIEYEGIYSFLAHEFAARNFSDVKYLNRQEDMGIEGLRKSKLSYCPEFLLNKYVLTPKCGANLSKFDGEIMERYPYKTLNEEHFNLVMSFLKAGIASLDDKKFFLNYRDGELMQVLRQGHMLGAFDGEKLIATAAVDLDKGYGDILANICGDASGRQFYEFSGIMVDRAYRGKGIAFALCSEVIAWARQNLNGSTLCAVVQRGNEPSLGNLKKLGFKLSGEAPYGEYDFEYLTLNI